MEFKESDVEAAFAEWLDKKEYYKVVGRQVALPFGKVDVLASMVDALGGMLVVVEVKRGRIDLSACGQLFGYIAQIDHLQSSFISDVVGHYGDHVRSPWPILVGASIEPEAARLVYAMHAGYYQYTYEDGKFDFSDPYEQFWLDPDAVKYDERLRNIFAEMAEREKAKLLARMRDPENRDGDRPVNEHSRQYSIAYWTAGKSNPTM